MARKRWKVCFITGTRAEFGLMASALGAIRRHRALELQVIATGMHLDAEHGRTLEDLARAGFEADAVIEWPAGTSGSPALTAAATGKAMAGITGALQELGSEVVLVVGDRVEALAGAAAGHLSGRVVAHVHGGDRALGQVDDALRHAITKLAHVHFPATRESAQRIARLGEQPWRIHRIGSPGLDGIRDAALPRDGWPEEMRGLERRRYAIVLLHPVDAEERIEERRARGVLSALRQAGIEQGVLIYPNNDPGAGGIIRTWEGQRGWIRCRSAERGLFLGLLRDSAILVGNSSSGIIEAASFGVPVVDIGPRQEGRERSLNVVHCEYGPANVRRAVERFWRGGEPVRMRCSNVYGGGGAGERMADILARLAVDGRLLRKLIAY